MAITIDPSTKRFVLDSPFSSAQAIYRAWVDWAGQGDNSKYLPAFRAVGGDDLGGGRAIPGYYFLTNGWRVRPMEADHTLNIDGNLFVEEGGNPVVRTIGAFNVLVNLVVPVQAQALATSGGSSATPSQIASQVRLELAQELLAIIQTQTKIDATF